MTANVARDLMYEVDMNARARNKKLSIELSEMLTTKELEALLKIDQKTIYKYVAHGMIPYVRIQSNIRFIKSQIEEWISEQTYQPAALHKAVAREDSPAPHCPNCPYRS
jgi:excisionase family DNA binding protein